MSYLTDDHMQEPSGLLVLALAAGLVFGLCLAVADSYWHFIPAVKGYTERCIDGVAYIDNSKMITPKLLVDGKPASCHE